MYSACVSSGIHGNSKVQRNITPVICYHLGEKRAADEDTARLCVDSLVTYTPRERPCALSYVR
jgi:hypothetical protein